MITVYFPFLDFKSAFSEKTMNFGPRKETQVPAIKQT